MRLKDTKTVKAMIDRIGQGGGGETGGAKLLKLSTYSVAASELEITDENDIDVLLNAEFEFVNAGNPPEIVEFDYVDARNYRHIICGVCSYEGGGEQDFYINTTTPFGDEVVIKHDITGENAWLLTVGG